MNSKKKSSSPFAGLFGGGRNKKGNLEDLIHQFIIQDPNVKSMKTENEDKRIKTQLKKVKKDKDKKEFIEKLSIEQDKKIKIENEEENLPMFPPDYEADFDKNHKKKTPRKKSTLPITYLEEEGENKKETKNRSNRFKSKIEQKTKDSKEKTPIKEKKKREAKGKKASEEEEEENDMSEGVMFDDNQLDDTQQHEEKLPYWLQEGNIKDEKGRRSNESDYDPTTVEIPEIEYDKLPKIQKKYWDFKKKYFDKVVAFKMWSCYFFYGNDALIVHRLWDTVIRYYQGRVYSFCSEKVLYQMIPKLLDAGYHLVVLKQTNDYLKGPDADKSREVFQILTKGTYAESSTLTYSSQFCLCIYEQDQNIGLVYFDTTTHEFYVGEFKDDESRNNLRTILTRIKPSEVVYYKNYISKETMNILKSLPSQPCLSLQHFSSEHVGSLGKILEEIQEMFAPKDESRPPLPELINCIKQIVENEKQNIDYSEKKQDEQNISNYFTLKALFMCLNFLKNIMLADNVFSMGNFFPYDLVIDKKSTLYLDSQALQNLEILDVEYLNSSRENKSLFGYIDHTITPFGKRMLKRWLISPLLISEEINERLQAVEDLVNEKYVVKLFQKEAKNLPDLERIITRIYGLAGQKKSSGVKFEDFVKNKLLDFLNVLEHLEKVERLMNQLQPAIDKFQSIRLKKLITLRDVSPIEILKTGIKEFNIRNNQLGLFPKMSSIITELKNMIYIKDGLLVPVPGLNPEIDSILIDIDKIKEQFQIMLEEQRDFFRNKSIKYVHIKRRYELEIPEDVLENIPKPKDYVTTSKKKGFIRLQNSEIEETVNILGAREIELQNTLLIFMTNYFRKFYDKNIYWHQIVSCLAEIDCLCSLAQLAQLMPNSCRPIVLPSSDKPIFDLQGIVHPCIASNNPNFVSNDFIVENEVRTFLITGPNMGGKSTLLRQICLAIVMAQIGSFVPANSFRFSVVDRIFTRIGASDRITEGKSTFFIELEETYNILSEASQNSLVIIDELGRGTSTYDGVSIAYSTLKYINERMRCITLFATHYHLLLEEFKLYKNIENYFMASEFDKEKEEITFKYKFMKGEANKSHGVAIAKMAGIPKNVLNIAKEKADFMTTEKRNIGFEKNLTDKFNRIIEQLKEIEDNSHSFHVEEIFEELCHL